MTKKTKSVTSDLQGLSQITVDGVKGIIKVTESLHSTISHLTPILGSPKEKTSGLTRMIYSRINATTHLIGQSINTILSQANKIESKLFQNQLPSYKREAISAAMNGVLGDHLDKSNNPLTIEMAFKRKGTKLNSKELNEIINENSKSLTILIHGLCMNDLQWNRDNHDHGDLLSQEMSHNVIYLHYNTGRHVSENGKLLATLLDQVTVINPDKKINILAHSMGGLVARSACYYANKNNYKWIKQLKSMVFLGTPHHGAVLAKGGHWLDTLMKISPYSIPFAKISTVRSNGLMDLRQGNIIDQHWLSNDSHENVPLPKNVNCYAIATTVTDKKPTAVDKNIIGDGLVTLNSALGINKNHGLGIPKNNQWTGKNISHMQLLSDKKVYAVIKKWLSA